MAAFSQPNENLLDARSDKKYAPLFRKFVLLTVVCSLVPLLLVGWGINLHYTRFAQDRVMAGLGTQLEHHRKFLELFINQRADALYIIANTHLQENLVAPSALATVFDVLNHSGAAFTDLGVIGEDGSHLAYVGPYDLMNKNYAKAFWFAQVMEKGVYISDMFMGFRQEPHFIIAVVREQGQRRWILRATVDTEVFRSLVESTMVGKSGEVLLLSRDGVFQTSPRFSGKIMEKASVAVGSPHEEIRMEITRDPSGKKQIAIHTWLKEPGWMLMVRQDYREALETVNHANTSSLIGLHLSALIILAVTMLITRHMIGVVRQRDRTADQLNQQYLQASKLASIGQLSAGVAHEINNPLAIILTERQILMDMEGHASQKDPAWKTQFQDSMDQIDIQIQRCKRITQNLLRFARRTQSLIETVDINAFINEVVDLMEREAKTSGIKFIRDLDDRLPEIESDPSQLQQVFLNLITNAMDAHDGKPYGAIRITSQTVDGQMAVRVVVSDTGAGIHPEDIEKIFDPFFTTKPVGKGTGLGLSICYSIIQRLGGTIQVASTEGESTDFTLTLPLAPPAELVDAFAKEEQEH